MHITAIINQKGGTGKTTTAVNLAAGLALLHNKKVLVTDIDPQGNATSHLGIEKRKIEHSVANILVDENIAAKSCLLDCPNIKNLSLIGANLNLSGIDIQIGNEANWQYRLSHSLAQLSDEFDFCFIDCPPSLNVLSVSALYAADLVLVPMQCEYFALEGLSDLVTTVRRIKKKDSDHQTLQLGAIVRMMSNQRSLLAQDISHELEKHFPDILYNTIIPRNIKLAEAPGYGLPIFLHDKKSAGAQAFSQLVNEFLEKYC